MHGIESKWRGRPAEESLAVFEQMVAGTEEGQRYCIRYKMDMQARAGARAVRRTLAPRRAREGG